MPSNSNEILPSRVFGAAFAVHALGNNPVLYLPRLRHNQHSESVNSDEDAGGKMYRPITRDGPCNHFRSYPSQPDFTYSLHYRRSAHVH